MDKQKLFSEEVLNKIANLNSHIEKLNDILEDIYISSMKMGLNFLKLQQKMLEVS